MLVKNVGIGTYVGWVLAEFLLLANGGNKVYCNGYINKSHWLWSSCRYFNIHCSASLVCLFSGRRAPGGGEENTDSPDSPLGRRRVQTTVRAELTSHQYKVGVVASVHTCMCVRGACACACACVCVRRHMCNACICVWRCVCVCMMCVVVCGRACMCVCDTVVCVWCVRMCVVMHVCVCVWHVHLWHCRVRVMCVHEDT